MKITAKVKCTTKDESSLETTGTVSLGFMPDYQDDKNKEWAKATPALSLSMSVIPSVAEQFEQGRPYTLTFSEE